MGLLDDTTQKQYYQGSDYGGYQFVSLDDVITQFQIMYVGEDKIISKASRTDVAFHAQRALAELSFDTIKSFKSQQIDVPSTLTMILPHDYVNYTKIAWVDAAGIKRPMYPTKHTSNPFQVKQETNGEYSFESLSEFVKNPGFDDGLNNWEVVPIPREGRTTIEANKNILSFNHASHKRGKANSVFGHALAVWQKLDVTDVDYLDIEADGVAVAAAGVGTAATPAGVLRFGLSTRSGDMNTLPYEDFGSNPDGPSNNQNVGIFDIPHEGAQAGSYIEWRGASSDNETKYSINVAEYDVVYALVTSYVPHTNYDADASIHLVSNKIDNISVTGYTTNESLTSPRGNEINSSTWNTYKSATPSENSIEDYRYEQHWLNPNERYGLEPSHAQINGSFFIDQRLGKIHFSSNISGKTVILDYISDSLGSDSEMQVPKLAEDAMYKHMLYDLISTRSNIGGGRLNFHKKEKFAAVRKAKLRLSNIKLEELTQILRGQSKQIKH